MILLTGASGFIGKHLLSALIKEYGSEHVLAFTSVPVSNCRYLLHNDYNFDSDYFVKAGFANSIKTIIHAGAFIPKNNSHANNWQKCNFNVINTDKLLKASLPVLEKFIYLSTVDIYGSDEIISEESPVKPVSLYGDSKLYSEKMIAAWAGTEGKIYQLLRIGHTYGPGEEMYQKVIPVTITKLLEGKPLQIWGAGTELRSFIYINDLVTAILNSVKLDGYIGPVNIASSQRISIKELVDKLIIVSGIQPVVEKIPSNTPGRNLVFDNSKMKKYLSVSETPLDEGLSEEWNYMRQRKG